MTLDEAAAMALALPEVTEGVRYGNRTWCGRGQGVRLGAAVQQGRHQALRRQTRPRGRSSRDHVDELEREGAVLQRTPDLFTIPHFDNYPAVLVELRVAGKKAVREVLLDGWLDSAPEQLAREYLERGD